MITKIDNLKALIDNRIEKLERETNNLDWNEIDKRNNLFERICELERVKGNMKGLNL